MDADYIKQHDVINRYVLQQLTEEELVSFELYFLEHPEVLDDVAEVEALKAGLASHRTELTPEPAALPAAASSIVEWVAAWFQRPVIQFANFAALAVLLGLQFSNVAEKPKPGGYSAERVWLGEVRGDESAMPVRISAASVLFDIDVEGAGVYEVTLLDSSGGVVSRARELSPRDDVLLVVFDSSVFTDGLYRLTVADASGNLALQKDLAVSVAP